MHLLRAGVRKIIIVNGNEAHNYWLRKFFEMNHIIDSVEIVINYLEMKESVDVIFTEF